MSNRNKSYNKVNIMRQHVKRGLVVARAKQRFMAVTFEIAFSSPV